MLDHHRLTFTLPLFDSTSDITDLWRERTDPEGEFGQTCDAHFRHGVKTIRVGLSRKSWQAEYLPELVGLTVTGGEGSDLWSLHLPRDLALTNLGQAAVADLERNLMTKLEEVA